MKYKVGDKVIIRKDLDLNKTYESTESSAKHSVVSSMTAKAGQTLTIESVDSSNGDYRLIEIPHCLWVDTMFEEPFKNGETVIYDGSEYRYVGMRQNGHHVLEDLYDGTFDVNDSTPSTEELTRPGAKEYTLDEIAEALNIPVKDLKIKK